LGEFRSTKVGEEGGKGNALANGVGNADDDSDVIGDSGRSGESVVSASLSLMMLMLMLM
jgi:hypothetical protein